MAEHDTNVLNIERMARANDKFRDVVWTGDKTQLVLMAIPPEGAIGGEVHEGHDQLLYFVDGTGKATIGEAEFDVGTGDVAIVPAGKYHNFANAGGTPLKLYTTYSPPEHAPGTEHETRQEADTDPDED